MSDPGAWSPAPAIRLDHVTLSRPGFRACFDLSLPVGAVMTVIGPSGAGKSTLLDLIAGFEKPTSGHILFENQDMTQLGPEKRPVSMIFQDGNLFNHLDVETNVGLAISPRLRFDAEMRERIHAALDRVGLAGFARRMPATLSGGERQRAALARTLVRDRPILLLDEPFSALGPGLRHEMVSLVNSLQAQTGISVMLVSHHPQDALRLGGMVCFVTEGHVAGSGMVKDFFTRRDVEGLQEYLGNQS